MGLPPGWKDDGTRLTAPNGQSVVLRFRWYILTHPWTPDDWPLESEHYAPQADITAPEQGDGMVQYFRKSILAWNEQSNLVSELSSGAVALAWQHQAWSRDPGVPAADPGWYTITAPPGDEGDTQRLARLEKQMQILMSGLQASARLHQCSGEDQPAMVARDIATTRLLYRPFSSPSLLLRWLLLLLGLLAGDVTLWVISSLIHGRPVFSLPLLVLGTVALSASFYFLISLTPSSDH